MILLSSRSSRMPSILRQIRFPYNTKSDHFGSNYQYFSISEKFASFLEDSTDICSLRKLHACIFIYGLGGSILLGTKLVCCYAKSGLLAESRLIFDRIINKNLSLWNSILIGYFRAGQYSEVIRRYSNLKEQKIGLNSSAITFCLKSCIKLGTFGFGRELHVDAFKSGFSTNGFVGSSLILLYSNYGNIEDASKVFDEINERDVVVYTSMITVYAQFGYPHAHKAFKVARRMQKNEIEPNRVTLVSLLQAAAELEAIREGRSIHGYAIRRGIGCLDEVFETSLIDMYMKCASTGAAACAFRRMEVKKTGYWNVMITGYLQMGQPLEAFKLFSAMVQENGMRDQVSLANGISCCSKLKFLSVGKSIHGHIIRLGLHFDLVSATALLDMYSKCNNMIQARKLFVTMGTKDAISYDVMMAGYLENEFAREATEAFAEMVGSGVKPNLGSILHVLCALTNIQVIRGGRCVHGYVLRHGFHENTEVPNQLICMYSKCCCMVSARQVFNMISCKDLVSWTSMMMAYVHHGNADETINLFRIMKREKLPHDSVTLISLLLAFSQLGYLSLAKELHCHLFRVEVERETLVINSLITTYAKLGKLNMARALFEHCNDRCLTSWNTIIAAYGMHGGSVDALRLFDRMKTEMIRPDEVTFTSILSACSHSGLVEEGLQAFRSMTEEYSITPRKEHYGCIVDLLSRAGRLEDAYDLVELLPARESASALSALLAACRVHGNTEMGGVVGKRLLGLEPENSSVYGLVSNVFAEGGKWEEVERIRDMAKKRGLRKTPAYSVIELNEQVSEL